jgi:hypothetical protein
MMLRTGLSARSSTLDHVPLDPVQHPKPSALRHDVVDVFLGYRSLDARTHPQQPESKFRRAVEDPDDRRRRRGDDCEGLCYAHCDRFRVAEGDLLGGQLADDQGDVGHRDRHDHYGERSAVVCQAWHDHQDLCQPFGKHRAAEYSGERGRHRETDLNGSQQAGGLVGKLERSARPGLALPDQAFQVPPARGDDGEFRHGKQAVHHEENQNDCDFECDHRVAHG